MSDKIIELGRHDPSVESVITRLYQNIDKVSAISCVIEWNDGSSDVCGDTKDVSEWAFQSAVLQKAIMGMITDTEREENNDR